MRCPNCGARLVELERSQVLIDACPDCRGVWLDRGELDKVLEYERRASVGAAPEEVDFEREMSGPRPARERHYDDDPRAHPADYKKRRRRSILEDILDF